MAAALARTGAVAVAPAADRQTRTTTATTTAAAAPITTAAAVAAVTAVGSAAGTAGTTTTATDGAGARARAGGGLLLGNRSRNRNRNQNLNRSRNPSRKCNRVLNRLRKGGHGGLGGRGRVVAAVGRQADAVQQVAALALRGVTVLAGADEQDADAAAAGCDEALVVAHGAWSELGWWLVKLGWQGDEGWGDGGRLAGSGGRDGER